MTALSATTRLPTAPAYAGAAHTARLTQVVEQFEGILWSEVADTLLSAKLGPGLGFAGSVYQHMLWRAAAEQDFGPVDQGMTATLLNRFLGGSRASVPNAIRSAPQATELMLSDSVAGTSAENPVPAVSLAVAEAWARHVWAHLVHAARALDVPAEGLLAQSALETDWGRHVPGHNLFGVKARGSEPAFVAPTFEYVEGTLRKISAVFVRYGSAAAAAADYVRVIRRAFPQAIGKSTVAGFARALQQGGYATDPRYASKIEAIARSNLLHDVVREVQNPAVATNIYTVDTP